MCSCGRGLWHHSWGESGTAHFQTPLLILIYGDIKWMAYINDVLEWRHSRGSLWLRSWGSCSLSSGMTSKFRINMITTPSSFFTGTTSTKHRKHTPVRRRRSRPSDKYHDYTHICIFTYWFYHRRLFKKQPIIASLMLLLLLTSHRVDIYIWKSNKSNKTSNKTLQS